MTPHQFAHAALLNSIGFCLLILLSSLTQAGAAPQTPQSLVAYPGDAFVALSWEIDRERDDSIIRYQYRLGIPSGRYSDWIDMPGIEPSATGYIVSEGVQNDTTYAFQIRSLSATQMSPPSNQARVTPRDRSPRLQEVSIPWYGTAIFASYSEPLLAVNGKLPDSRQFRVEINGVVVDTWVEVRQSMVKLTPDRVIYEGDTVKVSYASSKHGAMQDHTGNVVASFGPVTAWNESRQARSSGAGEDTSATR